MTCAHPHRKGGWGLGEGRGRSQRCMTVALVSLTNCVVLQSFELGCQFKLIRSNRSVGHCLYEQGIHFALSVLDWLGFFICLLFLLVMFDWCHLIHSELLSLLF